MLTNRIHFTLAAIFLVVFTATGRGETTVDQATLDQWSAPYRGWTYWPEHVVPVSQVVVPMHVAAPGHVGSEVQVLLDPHVTAPGQVAAASHVATPGQVLPAMQVVVPGQVA